MNYLFSARPNGSDLLNRCWPCGTSLFRGKHVVKAPGNYNQVDTLANLWKNKFADMSSKTTKNFVYPESTAESKSAKRLRAGAN